MTPEQILAIKPKVLTQAQREAYFNDGFLFVPKAIGEEWLAKLRAANRRARRAQPQRDPVGHGLRPRASASRRGAAPAPRLEPGRAAPGVLGLLPQFGDGRHRRRPGRPRT
jgi:hypothetical protein